MQGFNKECGVIGEPSLKFKSVAISLPKKHRKFRAAPQLRRSMRNARTVPGQLATQLLHRSNTTFAPPARGLLQQAWSQRRADDVGMLVYRGRQADRQIFDVSANELAG
ncbi:hypothetical protein [Burkholderia cepacia]|uniref:hypothetical protein n=1 Tax=Burkholderia cepacia TaxID=292 RepID=UPI0012D9B2B3|nr:hypothetical protein [Burkholderia cepacia]